MSEWIEWSGGECPVGGDTIVEVELRAGMTCIDSAKNLRWVHFDWPGDITRYRISQFSSDAGATKTLRDEFAMAALTGLLAGLYRHSGTPNLSEVPAEALRIADAMLAARKEKAE